MSENINQQKNETIERQSVVYQDFNLRFGSYNEADSTYKVWVEGDTPGGGTMRPDDATIRTYNPNDFWSDPSKGTGGLLGRLERRNLARQEMFTLGHLLTDLALPEGRVRDLFRQSVDTLKAGEGLRLRLHIDPIALAQLPWELLALSQASGEPQARRRGGSRPAARAPPDPGPSGSGTAARSGPRRQSRPAAGEVRR